MGLTPRHIKNKWDEVHPKQSCGADYRRIYEAEWAPGSLWGQGTPLERIQLYKAERLGGGSFSAFLGSISHCL